MTKLDLDDAGRPGSEARDPVQLGACISCVYFRAFTDAEQKDSKGVVNADGWCFASPPQIGIRQGKLGGGVVEPVRPPTRKGDVCRYWNAEFAGDSGYAAASALEDAASRLWTIAELMRELVQTGTKI